MVASAAAGHLVDAVQFEVQNLGNFQGGPRRARASRAESSRLPGHGTTMVVETAISGLSLEETRYLASALGVNVLPQVLGPGDIVIAPPDRSCSGPGITVTSAYLVNSLLAWNLAPLSTEASS
jgi:hypothetical protein